MYKTWLVRSVIIGVSALSLALAAAPATQAARSPAHVAASAPAPGARVINVTSPTQIPSSAPGAGIRPANKARPNQIYQLNYLRNNTALGGPGNTGLCLAINPESYPYYGNPVGLYECLTDNANNDQEWWWAPVANMPVGYYTIQNGAVDSGAPVGLCLDGDTSTIPNNDTKVQLWGCDGVTNQTWIWNGSTLQNLDGNECLGAVPPNYRATVQLWSCDGATNQNWTPTWATLGH
jgi:hypothetical protein